MDISVRIGDFDVIDSGRFHILPDISSAKIDIGGIAINVVIERIAGPHNNPIQQHADGSVTVIIRPDSLVSTSVDNGTIAQVMISLSPMFDKNSGAYFLEYTAFRFEIDK